MKLGISNSLGNYIPSSVAVRMASGPPPSSPSITYIAANTFSIEENNDTSSVISVVSSQVDEAGATKTDAVKLVVGKNLGFLDDLRVITSSGISALTDGSTVNLTFSFFLPTANGGDSTASFHAAIVGQTSAANNRVTATNANLGEWNTATGTITVGSNNDVLKIFVDDAGGGAMRLNDIIYFAEIRVY